MDITQLIAAIGVLFGIFLYDKRSDRSGPLISMWACVLWVFITFSLDQPAMVVLNLILAGLHFRNYYTRRYPL